MLVKDFFVDELYLDVPFAGFGENGEGYFRLTAFGSERVTAEAVARIEKLFG